MMSSINSVRKTEQLSAKQAGLCSHSIYKNKLKWIRDLNVRPDTIKLLSEENIDSMLFDVGLSSIFLDPSPQAREIKATINGTTSI